MKKISMILFLLFIFSYSVNAETDKELLKALDEADARYEESVIKKNKEKLEKKENEEKELLNLLAKADEEYELSKEKNTSKVKDDKISTSKKDSKVLVSNANVKEKANKNVSKKTKSSVYKDNKVYKIKKDEYNELLRMMTSVIYSESGNQPLKGQIAVGNTVLNRTHSKNITVSKLKNVLYAPHQYGVIRNGTYQKAYNNYNTLKKSYGKTSYIAAKKALAGENVVGNFDSFDAVHSWQAQKYMKLRNGVVIKDHYFWKY